MILTRLTIATLAAAALGAITLIPPATAGPKEDLLKEAGKRIERAYSNRDPESPYDDRTLAKLRESSAACLKAIDDAVAAGATLDDEVAMPHKQFPNVREAKNEHGYWIYLAPMREGQVYCRSLAAKPDMLQLDGQLRQDDGWLSKSVTVRARAEATDAFDNQARDEAEVMAGRIEPCRAAVALALKAGVTRTTPIELKHAGRITVGDARVKVCDALAAAAQAILDVEAAKLEAKLAPYKVVLKGQKLSTFLEREMLFDTIYGKGGQVLDTPAALAKASAWFILLEGDVGLGLKYVTVRKYQWSKNKLKSVKERHGCCT